VLFGLSSLAAIMVIAACSGGATTAPSTTPTERALDIGKVLTLKSTFGPDFQVASAGPAGIDPKLLAPQKLPDGITFDPPPCADAASKPVLPSGLKGNMAALIATGEGNRFIVIAVETSEPVPYKPPADSCRNIKFAGPNIGGTVDVIDAPQINGAHTLGTRRVLQASVGRATSSGQLYTFAAYLGRYLVIVTADPLVLPNQPVTPVNVTRAQEVFTNAVAAVRS
jgi:hypothetical protein